MRGSDGEHVTRAALVLLETRSGRGRRRDRAIGRSRPPKTAAQVVLGAGLCFRSETRGGCRTVVGAHVLAGHALALDEILLPDLHADTLSVLRPLVVAFGSGGREIHRLPLFPIGFLFFLKLKASIQILIAVCLTALSVTSEKCVNPIGLATYASQSDFGSDSLGTSRPPPLDSNQSR